MPDIEVIDAERDFWIKVPEQDEKKDVTLVVLIPEESYQDKRFKRHVLNFYVLNKDKKVRTHFNPALELKVGFKDTEKAWKLHFWDEKETDPNIKKLKKFEGDPKTKSHKKSPNTKLYKFKGHTHVKLNEWGDPNVGWV